MLYIKYGVMHTSTFYLNMLLTQLIGLFANLNASQA